MTPKNFHVTLEPDGSGWRARVAEVKDCWTWGRSLTEARRNLRKALVACVCLDATDDAERAAPEAERAARAATFTEDVRLPAAAKRELARYKTQRERFDAEEERLRAATQSAARALLGAGMSLRDAGELMGLSHERVKQVTT